MISKTDRFSRFAIITTVAVMTCLCSVFSQPDAGLIGIPGGSFLRGSSEGLEDEQPVNTVRVSSFSIMAREVSTAQYNRCVFAGKCTPAHYDDGKCIQWTGRNFEKVILPEKYQHPDYPVVCVTWLQARAYCSYVGMKLPTEAQWEYAARAGANSRYAWGNAVADQNRCVVSGGSPRAVGSFPPNSFGLFDMTGNVWEWTADYYEKDYYSHSEREDPKGPEAGLYRVIRGGGWYSGAEELRASNRHWFSPSFAEVSVGFRCAR